MSANTDIWVDVFLIFFHVIFEQVNERVVEGVSEVTPSFNWPIKYTLIQTTCITQIVIAGFWFHEHPAKKWTSPVLSLHLPEVPPHQRASKEFVLI